MNLVDIVCDSQEEADFAVHFFTTQGYKNIQKIQPAMYSLIEVEGEKPNYKYTGRYARGGGNIWIIRAEK